MKRVNFLVFFVLSILIFSISFSSAARLPVVGADDDAWGAILNNYLSNSLGENGTSLNISEGNLTLGERIIFSSGIVLDNIVNNWLRIDSNLNVTGNLTAQNITADYFIGDGSQISGLSTSQLSNDLNFVNYTNISQFNNDFGFLNSTNFSGSNVTANYFFGDGSGLTGISSGRWNVSGTDFYPESLDYDLGIGTNTPQNKLDVEGGVAIGAGYSGSNSAPTNGLIVQGNVGIGINNPTNVLHLQTSTNTVANFKSTNNRANFIVSDDDTTALFGAEDSRFYIGGSGPLSDGAIVIDTSNKDVGIGTINPQNKLNVIGDGNFTNNLTVDENLLFVDSSIDRLGIGTTSPSAKLDIKDTSSQLKLTYNDTSYSYFYVQDDGDLRIDPKGDQIFIGRDAGQYVSSGISNTIIGADAGESLTTGSRNMMFGDSAGKNLISGTDNMFIGQRAGQNVRTGNYNAFVGREAGRGNGASSYTASSNVAIGDIAGYSLDTGSDNVLLGVRAGIFIDDGGQNVIIGRSSAGTLASGSNNIVIGSYEDVPSSSIDYHLNIGGAIYGNLSSGNVGIGTTDPSVSLEINSTSTSGALRIRGDSGVAEIADIYVQGGGNLVLDTTSGTDVTGYIEVRPEDNEWGFLIRESDGTGFDYANLYMTDATDDYFSIDVNEGTHGNALVVTESHRVGIGTVTPQNELNVVGDGNFTGNVSANYFIGDGSGLTGISSGSWNVSGSNLFPENLNYNVGIGTNSPTGRFHVNSTSNGAIATIESNTTSYGRLDLKTGGNTWISPNSGSGDKAGFIFQEDSSIGFAVLQDGGDSGKFKVNYPDHSGSNFLTITTSGNVGIGTSSPSERLEVSDGMLYLGASGTSRGLKFNTNGANDVGHFYYDSGEGLMLKAPSGGTQKINVLLTTNSVADRDFKVMNSDEDVYFAVKGDGNVGINTTSPESNLHILGPGGVGSGLEIESTDSNSYGTIDFTNSDGNLAGQFLVTNPSFSNGIFEGDKFSLVNYYSGVQLVAGGNSGIIQFATGGYGASDERMRIDKDGNVGIGSSSPVGNFNVVGDGNFTGDVSATYFIGDGSQLTGISSGGDSRWNITGLNIYPENLYYKVGLGTTDPESQIHINGASPRILLESNTTTSSIPGIMFNEVGTQKWGIYYTTSGNRLYFYDHFASKERFRINDGGTLSLEPSGGTVAIGTTAAVNLLDVEGAVAIGSSYSGSSSAPSQGLIIQGDVGVGTDSPANKFNVVGDGNFTSNLTVGEDSLIVDSANDFVGIGTTDPQRHLHLNSGDQNVAMYIESTDPRSSLYFYDNDTTLETNVGFVAEGDDLIFRSGGNDNVRVDSSGRVGIGTDYPTFPLHIQSDSGNIMRVENTDGGDAVFSLKTGSDSKQSRLYFADQSDGNPGSIIYDHSVNDLIFNLAGSERLRILDTGEVGIGVSSPTEEFHVFGDDSSDATVLVVESNSDNAVVSLDSDTDYFPKLLFKEAGTKKFQFNVDTTSSDELIISGDGGKGNDDFLTITQTGNVGIGTTSPGLRLHVNDSIDGNIFRLEDSDGICNYNPESGSVTVLCSSDEKLKENIHEANSVLDEIKDISVKEYNLKATGDTTTGVIAQEIQETHPQLVKEIDGTLYVEQPNPWKLLKGIQELQEEIDSISTSGIALENINPSFNNEEVGQAKISSGDKRVKVNFKNNFEKEPIVTVTPVGLPNFFYGVDNINKESFEIVISQSSTQDFLFNWHAASSEGKILKSESNLEIIEEEVLEEQIFEEEIAIEESEESVIEISEEIEVISVLNETLNETQENKTIQINEEINETQENITIEFIEEENKTKEENNSEIRRSPLTGNVVSENNSESEFLEMIKIIFEFFIPKKEVSEKI